MRPTVDTHSQDSGFDTAEGDGDSNPGAGEEASAVFKGVTESCCGRCGITGTMIDGFVEIYDDGETAATGTVSKTDVYGAEPAEIPFDA